MSCAHEDVRYFENEKGALACMDCGRLFGHLVDGWVHPHNVITIDASLLREARRLAAEQPHLLREAFRDG